MRGGLPGSRDPREEISAEFETHIEHRVDDLVAGGMDPADARRRAEGEFGDRTRLGRECREERRRTARRRRLATLLDRVVRDLVFALRQMRRSPGWTLTVVLALTLGVGATTTVSSVVQAVVLAPLPFQAPDRLVMVEEVTPSGEDFTVSEPTYLDWRAEARSVREMGAAALRSASLRRDGELRPVATLWASASLLPTLGVEPVLGRGFLPSEDLPGQRAAVAVLGHRLWREAFGSDPDVLGEDLVVNGEVHRVVGVLPPSLPYLEDADLLVPLGASPAADRDEAYLDVVGRLAPGASLDGARDEMGDLARRLGEIHPVDRGWGAKLTPLEDVLVGPDVARAGWVLLTAAFLLLAIACVNVSSLLLSRATVRRLELSVRSALGAGRDRLTGQLLTESLLMAALGGAGGLVLAAVALPTVRALGAGRIPRLDQAALGAGPVTACLAATLLSALVFGLAPVLDLRRTATADVLRRGRAPDGRGPRLVRSTLVVGQLALSVVLLVGTGLLTRSFLELTAVDPGFEAEGTLTVRLSMPEESYDPEERRLLMRELVEAAEAVPGVERAGATVVDPFSGMNLMNFVARSDRMPDDAREFTSVSWRVVTPGFAEALGLDLLAGRSLDAGDGWAGGDAPALVNRTLADRFWPEGGAVGGTLVWGDPSGSRLRVVGVVEDLRDFRLAEAPFPTVFRPHAQIPWTVMTLIVRTRSAPGPLVEPLRTALRRVDAGLAVPEVRSLSGNVRRAVAGPRFNALLSGAFGLAGLALAVIGVYGVVSFAVSHRVREMGIRLALGARPSGLRRRVLADGLALALAGLGLGAVGAWVLGRWLSTLLYGLGPLDPATWSAAAGVLLGVTLVATWIPARRATRVEPRSVLGGP